MQSEPREVLALEPWWGGGLGLGSGQLSSAVGQRVSKRAAGMGPVGSRGSVQAPCTQGFPGPGPWVGGVEVSCRT